MRSKSLFALLILLGTASIVGVGCAARQESPAVFHYKKLLEQQKAGMPIDDKALKNLPEMTVADYERLGDSYFQLGNLNMAFIQYDKALRLDPSQVRLRYKMGLLFVKKGLPEDALAMFQEVLKRDASYALAYEGMGQAYLKVNRFKEAENQFRHSLTLNPQLWQSHNFLGMLYDRQQRFGEAIAEYQAAIQLKPDQGSLFNNVGMSYFLKGEHEKALDAFRETLKRGTANAKVYNNMGLTLGKLGRYQEALEAFKNGGDEAKAHNNLGVIYLAAGRYQEAIAAFERAIAVSPSYYLKASENLNTAKKALAEAASVPANTSKMTMPPTPVGRTGEADPDRRSAAPQPSTAERRSQMDMTLQTTVFAPAVEARGSTGVYYTVHRGGGVV
ncbi:MAG TPA: tetratricopeptide repeat protein [Candidatus Tectomicrobia bacterium]|nr:tetratricopeptide repeat protein [Candidatus Tectomicrobia bacterium]